MVNAVFWATIFNKYAKIFEIIDSCTLKWKINIISNVCKSKIEIFVYNLRKFLNFAKMCDFRENLCKNVCDFCENENK